MLPALDQITFSSVLSGSSIVAPWSSLAVVRQWLANLNRSSDDYDGVDRQHFPRPRIVDGVIGEFLGETQDVHFARDVSEIGTGLGKADATASTTLIYGGSVDQPSRQVVMPIALDTSRMVRLARLSKRFAVGTKWRAFVSVSFSYRMYLSGSHYGSGGYSNNYTTPTGYFTIMARIGGGALFEVVRCRHYTQRRGYNASSTGVPTGISTQGPAGTFPVSLMATLGEASMANEEVDVFVAFVATDDTGFPKYADQARVDVFNTSMVVKVFRTADDLPPIPTEAS